MDAHRSRGARAARSRARANRTRNKRSWPARRLFRNDQRDTLSRTCRAAAVITQRRAPIRRAYMHRIEGEGLRDQRCQLLPARPAQCRPAVTFHHDVSDGAKSTRPTHRRRKRGQQLEAFSWKNLTQLFLHNNNTPFSPTRPSKRTGHRPRYVPIRGGAPPRAGPRPAM